MNISVNHVSAGYGGKQVLKDVSISFESGQLTGIIGPNGCGKSTLLKCIYRLLSPWSGDIRIGDTILKDMPYRESAKRVAVLAQHHAAGFDFDVEEVVLMGRTPYKGITEGNNREDRDIAHRAMQETGVETLTVEYHKKPKVMILDRMSILASYGRKKIAGDMAASIGGVVPNTTAAVSDEMMMKLDPDVVFLVVYRDEEKELAWLRNRPAFRNLSFVKNHRLYGIPLKYVYGPQTRTIDAIGYMAERMYPGMFDFPKEYDFHPCFPGHSSQ